MSAISKHREKLFFPLREFCGMESVDKENKSPKLVIITATQPLSLRFEKKEDRDHWIDTIVTEGSFGEGKQLKITQMLKNGTKKMAWLDSLSAHQRSNGFSNKLVNLVIGKFRDDCSGQ